MNETIRVRVADLINSPRAVDAAAGERVFKEISPLLQHGDKVLLSFDGISLVITAFLNAAIGKLYGILPPAKVTELLEICDLDDAFQATLESSLEISKAFYEDPERLKRSIKEVMDEESGF
jgi:hypothetical protein